MASNKKAIGNEKVLYTKPDIYRETPLRYLGYAGSLGWICRMVLPFQFASMVSVAYVCGDIFDKASASAKRGDTEKEVITAAADAFTWQFIASFALPSVVIQGISGLSNMRRPEKCPRFFLLPCILSGVALPFISKPIDNVVDYTMQSLLGSRHQFRDDLEVYTCEKAEMDSVDNDDLTNKTKKYRWFFEQSRDPNDLELERYREKLRAQARSQGPPASPDQSRAVQNGRTGLGTEALAPELPDANKDQGQCPADDDGLVDRAVQVDKTTKPPKPPKPE